MRFRTLLIPLALLGLGACNDTTGPELIPCNALLMADSKPQGDTIMVGEVPVIELEVGTGDEVTVGRTIVVHYTGYLEDGTIFDSSCIGQRPFSFTVGAEQVIEGFDTGVQGMRASGVRRVIVPEALAYGENPPPGFPEGTLIFDVEVVSVFGQ